MKYTRADIPRAENYRFWDMVISFFALVLLFPLFICVAIVVLLTLGRPIFFVQERSGFMGNIFLMFKFRTIRDSTDKDARKDCKGLNTAIDSCRELVLHFLRDLKLDELPQFWNVLKGDMSLVGPRPEQPHIHQELCGKIPGFQQRLSLKPGITGWAQIHEPQAQALGDAERKLAWDIHYIQNQSLWLYFKILILTLGVLLVELPRRKRKQDFKFPLTHN